MVKYNLGLCEIHNKHIHGYSEKRSDPTIKGHYICHYIYKYNDYDDPYDDDLLDIDDDSEDYLINRHNYGILESFINFTKPISEQYFDVVYNTDYKKIHDFIRNYKTIISNKNYLTPQIMEIIILKGNEHVAILKTFWIRCLQRCWKRLVKKRTIILSLRKQPKIIKYKEVHGVYPTTCHIWPQVKGMWYNLSR